MYFFYLNKKIMQLINISKNTVHKLCLLAGAKQVSGLFYYEVRVILTFMIKDLAYASALYTLNARRKTINEKDVRHALFILPSLKNFHVQKNLKNVKTCKSVPTYDSHYSTHVNYIKKLRKIQKQHNCVHIPKTIFRNIFKKNSSKKISGFTPAALILAQIAIEEYIIKLLQHSVRSAIHAKRTMLMPKDIHLASATSNQIGNSHLLTDVNFQKYTYIVLKQVHPDMRISTSAKEQVQNIINLLGNKIALVAYSLTKHAGRKTLNSRDIQTSTRLVLQGALAKHAVSEATKAIYKYASAGRGPTLAKKAGLVFPPARANRFLKEYKVNLGEGAKIYLAGVLEYIVAEILEVSGNATRANKRRTIFPTDLMLAIAYDEELSKLCLLIGFDTSLGGVISFIPRVYMRKPTKKKSRKPTKKKSRKPTKKKSRK